MDYKDAIGEAVRTQRLAKGLSLRQVHQTAFISIGHLSEIERGLKEVSGALLEPIARSLGMETGELIVNAGLLMLGWKTEVPDTIADLPIDEYADILLNH